MFSWEYVDRLLATKSEGVGLIVRAINFQVFHFPTYVITNHQRQRQTDDMRSQDRKTKVHCAVKSWISIHYKPEAEETCSKRKRGLLLKVLREVKYITPVKTIT